MVQAAIAGDYGPEIQREILSKALAGEYGDEIKEGAKNRRRVRTIRASWFCTY